MKVIKNNSGTTLIELVASLPLGILVFLIMTIVLINFIISYQETRLFIKLQEDLFNTIETIRYGYLHAPLTGNAGDPDIQKEYLIGLMTAKKVNLGTNPNSIDIEPINLQGAGWVSRATYYVDDNGELKLNLTYPVGQPLISKKIFPDGNRKIGNELQFKIIDQDIFSIVKGTIEKPEIIKIHLKARVRFRKKSTDQSVSEDILLNTRTIEYNANVFIGNAN